MADSTQVQLPQAAPDGRRHSRIDANQRAAVMVNDIRTAAAQPRQEAPQEHIGSERVALLYKDLREAKVGDFAEPVAEEVARLVAILPDVAALDDPLVVSEAQVAAIQLTRHPDDADVALARMIRRDLERRLSRARMDALHPAVWLSAGLLGFLYVPAIIAWVLAGADVSQALWGDPAPTLAGERLGSWIWVAIAGTMGAAVSLLQRIATFEDIRGDRLVLVITGFSKPLIGAGFALFVFALLTGNMIPLDLPRQMSPAGQPYLHPLHLAIAFLAGFSERFIPDLAGAVERTIVLKVS